MRNSNLLTALIFTICGCIIIFTAASLQPVPGYLDAEYYYAVGIQLYEGEGLVEPFIWNFLNNPTAIPHPAGLYWMPLPSYLAAGAMWMFNTDAYWAARFPFLIMSAVIPMLVFQLAKKLHLENRDAILAGAFSLFTGFYLAYQSATETFSIFMLLGLFFWMTLANGNNGYRTVIALGFICGLMHLTRADGIVWFLLVNIFCLITINNERKSTRHSPVYLFGRIGVLWIGYLIPMVFWYHRNLQLFGSLFPPGNQKALWLTSYNQIFAYPPSEIGFNGWVKAGFVTIISNWFDAFITNIQTTVVVQSMLYLFPLLLLGIIVWRKRLIIKYMIWLWAATFLIMTVIFPFAGMRGGFFHSSSAFQSLVWIITVIGFNKILKLAQIYKKWDFNLSWFILGPGLVLISLGVTLYVYSNKVLNENNPHQWGNDYSEYRNIANFLADHGADKDSVVIIRNPARYYLISRNKSVVTPQSDISTLYYLSQLFQADFLVLEPDVIDPLRDMFESPSDLNGFHYFGNVGNNQIYLITNS